MGGEALGRAVCWAVPGKAVPCRGEVAGPDVCEQAEVKSWRSLVWRSRGKKKKEDTRTGLGGSQTL